MVKSFPPFLKERPVIQLNTTNLPLGTGLFVDYVDFCLKNFRNPPAEWELKKRAKGASKTVSEVVRKLKRSFKSGVVIVLDGLSEHIGVTDVQQLLDSAEAINMEIIFVLCSRRIMVGKKVRALPESGNMKFLGLPTSHIPPMVMKDKNMQKLYELLFRWSGKDSELLTKVQELYCEYGAHAISSMHSLITLLAKKCEDHPGFMANFKTDLRMFAREPPLVLQVLKPCSPKSSGTEKYKLVTRALDLIKPGLPTNPFEGDGAELVMLLLLRDHYSRNNRKKSIKVLTAVSVNKHKDFSHLLKNSISDEFGFADMNGKMKNLREVMDTQKKKNSVLILHFGGKFPGNDILVLDFSRDEEISAVVIQVKFRTEIMYYGKELQKMMKGLTTSRDQILTLFEEKNLFPGWNFTFDVQLALFGNVSPKFKDNMQEEFSDVKLLDMEGIMDFFSRSGNRLYLETLRDTIKSFRERTKRAKEARKQGPE